MIDTKDVIFLKVPYPNQHGGLAKIPHRYVVETPRLTLFNIQTAKPELVRRKIISHWVEVDPTVGPVQHRSYIGLDVRFILEDAIVDDGAKTATPRPLDKGVFNQVIGKTKNLENNAFLDIDELVSMNTCVRRKL